MSTIDDFIRQLCIASALRAKAAVGKALCSNGTAVKTRTWWRLWWTVSTFFGVIFDDTDTRTQGCHRRRGVLN